MLLTGAAGLIGMALRPMLASRGHNVVACDITATKVPTAFWQAFCRRSPSARLGKDRPLIPDDVVVAAPVFKLPSSLPQAVILCGSSFSRSVGISAAGTGGLNR
jgi:nucleoside-diphosphate-sugar epimerase